MFPEKECMEFTSDNNLDIKVLNEFESKLYGGIFSFCVGDMLGVPVEFTTREERKKECIR